MLLLFNITSCIDFFCIFLLDFVKQKFKTTSCKKSYIIQTQLDGTPKRFVFLWLNLNGLKPVSALTVEFTWAIFAHSGVTYVTLVLNSCR